MPKIGAPAGGEIEDRLAQAPAIDQLAHRRALAAGQDQPGDVVEIGRQAHRHPLDADGAERLEMLPERPLEGEDADSSSVERLSVVAAA